MKNFHRFAKTVTKGEYGKEVIRPTFIKSTADQFITIKYSTEIVIYLTKLDWFPPVNSPKQLYNLEPYTEDDIVNPLKKKTQNSAQGDDKILYASLT